MLAIVTHYICLKNESFHSFERIIPLFFFWNARKSRQNFVRMFDVGILSSLTSQEASGTCEVII